MEEQLKILQHAASLFLRIGIKSVSMDDIAKDLAISKKTIYKHFPDKKTLVRNVITNFLERQEEACTLCASEKVNALQSLISISMFVHATHKEMKSAVIFDLQKYYPDEWVLIESFRQNFIAERIGANIFRGQGENIFRADIDPIIITHLYISQITGVIELLQKPENSYDFGTLHHQMILYHLRGICTEKGLQLLEQYIHEL